MCEVLMRISLSALTPLSSPTRDTLHRFPAKSGINCRRISFPLTMRMTKLRDPANAIAPVSFQYIPKVLLLWRLRVRGKGHAHLPRHLPLLDLHAPRGWLRGSIRGLPCRLPHRDQGPGLSEGIQGHMLQSGANLQRAHVSLLTWP